MPTKYRITTVQDTTIETNNLHDLDQNKLDSIKKLDITLNSINTVISDTECAFLENLEEVTVRAENNIYPETYKICICSFCECPKLSKFTIDTDYDIHLDNNAFLDSDNLSELNIIKPQYFKIV